MITDVLATWMIANANISASEIYPNQAPSDATKPLVIYYLDSNSRIRTFDGTNATREANIQIEVYGKTLMSAQLVSNEIIAEIEDYVGAMGSLYIFDVSVESENNGFERGTELYSHTFDLEITYK